MIVLMLALVCVAGVAGAFVFRDRLRDIPGVSDLPGIGGNPSGIAPPPVQTGSATVGSGQAAVISMPNGPMIESAARRRAAQPRRHAWHAHLLGRARARSTGQSAR
jgi:hypothetical protein